MYRSTEQFPMASSALKYIAKLTCLSFGNDLQGTFTFKDKSVMDNVTAKASCFEFILLLCYRDGLVIFGLLVLNRLSGIKKNKPSQSPLWKNNCAREFHININQSQLREISDQLNMFPYSQASVEHISFELSELYVDAWQTKVQPSTKRVQ